MGNEFTATLKELIGKLKKLEVEPGENAWDRLVRFCGQKAMERQVIEPVERAVHKYISGMSEKDKRIVWSHTISGQMADENDIQWTAEDIDRELENEFLSEILEQAYRESVSLKRKQKRR